MDAKEIRRKIRSDCDDGGMDSVDFGGVRRRWDRISFWGRLRKVEPSNGRKRSADGRTCSPRRTRRHVTMARGVHNAFNEHLIAQLREAFRSEGDESVRVVVLAGEGKSFSAGADLDWMRRAASFSEEENVRDAAAAASLWRAIAECPKPVVARVHGNAFGGGAGLVAASDIAIASESAMFGFTEVRLGLLPATIAPHVVEKIGPGRALPLFLTGERFDAGRACEIGLVHQVVPDAQIDVAVGTVVDQLLSGGPEAQESCKELVRRVHR